MTGHKGPSAQELPMSDVIRTSPTSKKPNDPQARARLREAQAAEARAVVAVYSAEAKVRAAITRRDGAHAVADAWVAEAAVVRDRSRAALVSISGLDRAAMLLGIDKPELRRSLA